MASSQDPYMNLLRSLETELFPVEAVARQTGTFVFPEGVKVARGLSGLTLVVLSGVTALRFVKKSSRVRLLTTSETTSVLSTTSWFLVLTFANSLFQILYLSHLTDPHHIINLVTHAFRNFTLLAQTLALAYFIASNLVTRLDDTTGLGIESSKLYKGGRFRNSSLIGASILLIVDFLASLHQLFCALSLRESFHKARVNLLLLATSPPSSDTTTTSIVRVMAGLIETMQKDLQGLRWSEIGKDIVQVATQVSICLCAVLLLSNVSGNLPRFATSLHAVPRRIRFKRASSISKLPDAIVEEAQFEVEDSITGVEVRQSVFALVALTSSVFLFTVLSNFTLALDVLGRRWTAPVDSFGPTQLWTSYLYSGFSIVTLLYLAQRQLFPSSSTTVLPSQSSIMKLVPLARLRGVQTVSIPPPGYIIPPTSTPPPSPPLSLEECLTDKDECSSSVGSSPASIDEAPTLRSFPFPELQETTHARIPQESAIPIRTETSGSLVSKLTG